MHCKQTTPQLGTDRSQNTNVCCAYCQGVAAAITGGIVDDFLDLICSIPDQTQVAAALARESALLIPHGDAEIEPDADKWMHCASDADSDVDEPPKRSRRLIMFATGHSLLQSLVRSFSS